MGRSRRGVTEYLVAFSDDGLMAFDLETDLIIGLDKDGYIRRVNPAFEKTLGYRESHVIGTPVVQYVSIEDMALFVRIFYEKDRETSFRLLHSWTGVVTVHLVDYKFKTINGIVSKGLVLLREVKA